jgi:hypothetical protein
VAARSTSAQIQACLGQLKAQVAIGSRCHCQQMEQYYQQVNVMATFGQAPTLEIRGTQSRMTGHPSLPLQMVVRSSQLPRMDRSTRQVTCKYFSLSLLSLSFYDHTLFSHHDHTECIIYHTFILTLC